MKRITLYLLLGGGLIVSLLSACLEIKPNSSSRHENARSTNPMMSLSTQGHSQPKHTSVGNDKRVALVIGNGAYRHDNGRLNLTNPPHDAEDLATVLNQLGFTVILKENLDKPETENALQEFAQQLRGAKLGVLFYAGHGAQYQGENFLVSVNANPNAAKKLILRELVTLDQILATMEQTGVPTKVIILDACRNNPLFKDGLAMTQSQAQHGGGTFIAYSTQPGNTAADGGGRNSPYTDSLLRFIKEPNLPIEMLFKKVATTVSENTSGAQIPWMSSALLGGDLCLAGCFSATAKEGGGDNYCTTQIGEGLYQGECQNGLPHGQGVMKYRTGEYYQGSFKEGLRDGHGIQYFTDGTEMAGNFCGGRLCN